MTQATTCYACSVERLASSADIALWTWVLLLDLKFFSSRHLKKNWLWISQNVRTSDLIITYWVNVHDTGFKLICKDHWKSLKMVINHWKWWKTLKIVKIIENVKNHWKCYKSLKMIENGKNHWKSLKMVKTRENYKNHWKW